MKGKCRQTGGKEKKNPLKVSLYTSIPENINFSSERVKNKKECKHLLPVIWNDSIVLKGL